MTNEWMISMKNKMQHEKWEIPRYSKSEINNAGKIIADPCSRPEQRKQALSIVNNWRASHAYPLQVICSNLRLRNPNAIVVQRLKRLESITGKIERFPSMNLYRMQDLGGCRVIVDTIDQVYEAVNNYKTSRIRHILKRENDYIQSPQKSGYRSYHMVYQFHSDKKETYNQNMLIEIQFRTKLQHIWATAVEMMGIYTKSNLKSSQGDEDILRFFVLVSSVFAKMEHMPICPDTDDDMNALIAEIKDLDRRTHILESISHFNVIANSSGNIKTDRNEKASYYVLVQNYKKRMIFIRPFTSKEIQLATTIYNDLEAQNNEDENIVLVFTSSLEALKTAYPNYFTDISGFVEMMRRILA